MVVNQRLLRIGSRKSPLAVIQSNALREKIKQPQVEFLYFRTSGDRNRKSPLYSIGGKGLFMKEIEYALLDNKIDIAVHSMKDVPAFIDPRLSIPCIIERLDNRDAFISKKLKNIKDLRIDSKVGTSSVRRSVQLKCESVPIRGNLETRLSKVSSFDGIILAVAGLLRLNLEDQITQIIPINTMLPAVGQGAICAQCRKDDYEVVELLLQISSFKHFLCVSAERAFLKAVNGSCETPLGSFAEIIDDDEKKLKVKYMLSGPKGTHYTQRIGCEFDEMGEDAAHECKLSVGF